MALSKEWAQWLAAIEPMCCVPFHKRAVINPISMASPVAGGGE